MVLLSNSAATLIVAATIDSFSNTLLCTDDIFVDGLGKGLNPFPFKKTVFFKFCTVPKFGLLLLIEYKLFHPSNSCRPIDGINIEVSGCPAAILHLRKLSECQLLKLQVECMCRRDNVTPAPPNLEPLSTNICPPVVVIPSISALDSIFDPLRIRTFVFTHMAGLFNVMHTDADAKLEE
jgi:hypothetical protein